MAHNSQADLLSLKERLSENLSSAQLADTLDDLIFAALKPIMLATDHIEQTLAEMLPFVASNGRRKFAVMAQADLVNALFSVINGTDKKEKLKLLRSVRLERTIHFSCLKSFELLAGRHTKAEIELIHTPHSDTTKRYKLREEMKAIERRLNLRQGKNLFSVQAKAHYWHNQALEFKGMIIEKYVRLAYTDSMKAQADTELQIDLDDLFKNYVLAIPKAIDKFDPQKGALTSYIRWWFMDASTPFKSNSHEYGVNYHVPTAQRKKLLANGTSGFSNFSVALDDNTQSSNEDENGVLDRMIHDEDTKQLHNLAVRADQHRMAVLTMEIPYHLSADEKATLIATVVKARKGTTATKGHG